MWSGITRGQTCSSSVSTSTSRLRCVPIKHLLCEIPITFRISGRRRSQRKSVNGSRCRYWHLADNAVALMFVRFWTKADNSKFWREIVCPLMTQCRHSIDQGNSLSVTLVKTLGSTSAGKHPYHPSFGEGLGPRGKVVV